MSFSVSSSEVSHVLVGQLTNCGLSLTTLTMVKVKNLVDLPSSEPVWRLPKNFLLF